MEKVISYPRLAEKHALYSGQWGTTVQLAFQGESAVAVIAGWKTDHPSWQATPTITFDVIAAKLEYRDGHIRVSQELQGSFYETSVAQDLLLAAQQVFNETFLGAANP